MSKGIPLAEALARYRVDADLGSPPELTDIDTGEDLAAWPELLA